MTMSVRKRWTIADMRLLAENRDGTCVDSRDPSLHVKTAAKLVWQCKEGHQWEATGNNIQRGKWCPRCRGFYRTIEEMQATAQDRGGQCLSAQFLGMHKPLRWKCAENHEWEAVPSSIFQGSWCPHCAGIVPDTIEKMQTIAQTKGGRCVSLIYTNANTRLTWQCADGHQWNAVPSSIKSGTWCPVCAKHQVASQNRESALSIEEMREIAAARGGVCLSDSYTNAQGNLRWRCAKGHEWNAKPNSVKHHATWCPTCSGTQKASLADLRSYATTKGGLCLATEYLSATRKIEWQCAEGHRWKDRWLELKKGRWCALCEGRKTNKTYTIEDMRHHAEGRGGRCLSENYVKKDSKLKWECSAGHTWMAIPGSVIRGTWCPVCGGKQQLTIEEMVELAESRGGRCLSTSYTNAFTHLLWECSEGHQWTATPSNVKTGHWCPLCSESMGERICREFFEQLFEDAFPKSYPPWLRSKSQTQLELDGYCEKLGLAFEHQGPHHYENDRFFAKTKERLEKVRRNDRTKVRLCKQNGVFLISVPQIPSMLALVKVREFIATQCTAKGISLPDGFMTKAVDYNRAYASPENRVHLETLKKIAHSKNGECLSTVYQGANENLLWRCENNHQWETSPQNIKAGRWCPHCAGRRIMIDDLREIAKARGGDCLSSVFRRVTEKLRWRCALGHVWETTAINVRQGKWCHECGGSKQLSIESLHEAAKSQGGRCLSGDYINSKTHYEWECSKGHRWKAIFDSIRRGSWCEQCGFKKRVQSRTGKTAPLTLAKVKAYAIRRNGECLSETYVDKKTPMSWRCAAGHVWNAPYTRLRNGAWCPECGK